MFEHLSWSIIKDHGRLLGLYFVFLVSSLFESKPKVLQIKWPLQFIAIFHYIPLKALKLSLNCKQYILMYLRRFLFHSSVTLWTHIV